MNIESSANCYAFRQHTSPVIGTRKWMWRASSSSSQRKSWTVIATKIPRGIVELGKLAMYPRFLFANFWKLITAAVSFSSNGSFLQFAVLNVDNLLDCEYFSTRAMCKRIQQHAGAASIHKERWYLAFCCLTLSIQTVLEAGYTIRSVRDWPKQHHEWILLLQADGWCIAGFQYKRLSYLGRHSISLTRPFWGPSWKDTTWTHRFGCFHGADWESCQYPAGVALQDHPFQGFWQVLAHPDGTTPTNWQKSVIYA